MKPYGQKRTWGESEKSVKYFHGQKRKPKKKLRSWKKRARQSSKTTLKK